MRPVEAAALVGLLAVLLLCSAGPATVRPSVSPPVGAPPLSSAPSRLPTAFPVGPSPSQAEPAAPTVGESSLSPPLLPAPSASTPSSDVIETPPPLLPPTTPTIVLIANRTTNTTVSATINAPAGPWALIEFNFTGDVVPQVYDSSYHAMIDGVPIFFGTSPELYQWTVLKDITEYSYLFEEGPAQFTFVFGAATLGGHFVTSLSITFYPVPAGQPAPTVPTRIVPLWPFMAVSDSRLALHANATVPSDTYNATLELYAYGFTGGQSQDEFWYAANPAYRAVSVAVGSTPLVTVQPFEYVNTGGLDLFLWDPITGDYTADDRPYQVDVTPALGLLEGTQEYNISLTGLGKGSDWFTCGSLLLYTSPTVFGATIASAPAPSQSYANSTVGSSNTETVDRSYSFASLLDLPAGARERVEGWTNESFQSVDTTLSNSTAKVGVNAQSSVDVRWSGSLGSWWSNTTSAPSIGFEDRQVFTPSSTDSKGDTFGNTSYRMVFLDQNWSLSNSASVLEYGRGWIRNTSYVNDSVVTNGSYLAYEEIMPGGGADILSDSAIWANTSKSFSAVSSHGPSRSSFLRTLVSVLSPSMSSGGQAVVTIDRTNIVAAVEASEALVEVGSPLTLALAGLGGGGPFQYSWGGLPAGCVASGPSAAIILCSPSAAGSFVINASATGPLGTIVANAFDLTVLPVLAATVSTPTPAIDLGQSANLTAAVTGGLAPYECTWSEGGSGGLVGSAQSCSLVFAVGTPSVAGLLNYSLVVTDALGVSVSRLLALTVASDPIVELILAPSTPSAHLVVGATAQLEALVTGGVGPFTFSWELNGSAAPMAPQGSEFNLTPGGAGKYTITVALVDAAGLRSASLPVVLTVSGSSGGNNPPPHSGGGSSSTSGGLSDIDFELLGLAFVAAGAVAIALLVRRRRR